MAALATVGAASFVGTSIFALSGLLMIEPSVNAGEALRVIPLALLLDLLLAPVRAAAGPPDLPAGATAPGRVLAASRTDTD